MHALPDNDEVWFYYNFSSPTQTIATAQNSINMASNLFFFSCPGALPVSALQSCRSQDGDTLLRTQDCGQRLVVSGQGELATINYCRYS